jgi:hypothetical protein
VKSQFVSRLTVYALGTLIVIDFLLAEVNPKATGYDYSIYAAFPAYFWAALAVSYLLAIVVMLQTIKSRDSRPWWYGFLGFICVNFLIATLPLFRGYSFYGLADPGIHAGWAKQIYLSGHFFGPASPILLNFQSFVEDIYPATHVLAAILALTTGIPILTSAMLIPTIFLVFFSFSIYFCAKKLLDSRTAARIISMLGLPLLMWYQSLLLPEIATFELLPICLFIFFLPRSWKATALLSVMMSVLVFYHPFDIIMVIVFLSIINIGLGKAKSLPKTANELPGLSQEGTGGPKPRPWAFVVAPLLVWLTWFGSTIYFSVILEQLAGLYNSASRSQFGLYSGYLQHVNASLLTGIIILASQFAQDIALVMAALILAVVVFRTTPSGPPIIRGLVIVFLAFIVFTVVAVFSPLAIDFRRTLTYLVFDSELITGIGFWTLYGRHASPQGQKKILALVGIFLFSISMAGVFNFHESPLIVAPNNQISASEISGMTWFLGNELHTYPIYNPSSGSGMYQYVDASLIYGIAAVPSNIAFGTSVNLVPDHYGYLEHQYFGQISNTPFYFISNSFSPIAPSILIPQFKSSWAFTSQDWNRLQSDPTANLAFNNGGFYLYYVA